MSYEKVSNGNFLMDLLHFQSENDLSEGREGMQQGD